MNKATKHKPKSSYFNDDDDDDELKANSDNDNDSNADDVSTDNDTDDENENEDDGKKIIKNLVNTVEVDDDIDNVDDVDADVETDNENGSDYDNDNENNQKNNVVHIKQTDKTIIDDDSDDSDDEDTNYLQKFNKSINENYLINNHPECVSLNYDEIMALTKVVRDNKGIVIDELHKTIPLLTKYEKSRILGQRSQQIESGATVFIKIPENLIDPYLIAELELKAKNIPFIIRRPMPNGGSEYWNIKDLEII